MHYMPSQEMPALTYENYFVAKIDEKIAGFCAYKIVSSLINQYVMSFQLYI